MPQKKPRSTTSTKSLTKGITSRPDGTPGLSLRTLSGEFEPSHGFAPLMAESCHDPNEHTGTLYKATNWLPLGHTRGFKGNPRDFRQDTGKPNHLWIRSMKKYATTLLAKPGILPPAHQAAIAGDDTARARCRVELAAALNTSLYANS